jgi:hypothetical protein
MYKVKICDVCGEKFHPVSGAQKRCGKECRRVFQQNSSRERWRRTHKNRCLVCAIEIEKSKRYCQKHRATRRVRLGFLEELKSSNDNYERMMKLNKSIICFQQTQLEELKSSNDNYERMMKLNESIICSQQTQIDELLERNQELRQEKQCLERKIEMLERNNNQRGMLKLCTPKGGRFLDLCTSTRLSQSKENYENSSN